jgi:hypothetical protein
MIHKGFPDSNTLPSHALLDDLIKFMVYYRFDPVQFIRLSVYI